MRIAELFLKTNDQYHSLIWLLLEGPIFRHISAEPNLEQRCCAVLTYWNLCFFCCVVFYCVVFWFLCYTASHPKDHLPQQLPVCGFSKALSRYFLQRCRKKNTPVCPTSEYFWFRQGGEQLDYKYQSVHALFTTTCHARGN